MARNRLRRLVGKELIEEMGLERPKRSDWLESTRNNSGLSRPWSK